MSGSLWYCAVCNGWQGLKESLFSQSILWTTTDFLLYCLLLFRVGVLFNVNNVLYIYSIYIIYQLKCFIGEVFGWFSVVLFNECKKSKCIHFYSIQYMLPVSQMVD